MKLKGLILLFAAILFAGAASAQVNYGITNGTAYVGNSPNASGSIVISNYYNGYPVTIIEGNAFLNDHALTSVVIPDTVTTLQDGAFYSCSSLTTVTFGANVTGLGNYTFQNDSALASIAIPASVTNIGAGSFGACSSLMDATFLGNPPTIATNVYGTNLFVSVGAGAKVYYFSGTTGWGTNYGGLPTTAITNDNYNGF